MAVIWSSVRDVQRSAVAARWRLAGLAASSARRLAAARWGAGRWRVIRGAR